jgi:hypothetical protein
LPATFFAVLPTSRHAHIRIDLIAAALTDEAFRSLEGEPDIRL